MNTFEQEFLSNYLKFGLGSMPKSDIDALVMHLLDTYGLEGSPLANYSNQTVSERLKTPVAKIKKLRYEAALKFGGRPEDQAMGRLLAALSKASLEADGEKVCLIIEDVLAKHWLQGQLKIHQQIFDYSFNTEIVKVSASGLFAVLGSVFDKDELELFQQSYDVAKKKKTAQERVAAFKSAAKKFAESAASAAGAGVVKVLRAHLGL
ncbi:hypothetical protein [Methylophilus aquaticus]|uniref:DUF892 family protein n=1 Tax=Methylophilus aquaticus TaxID=1971610 RepID=A0ABT9JPD7_9PROT|nr:hypothetical protein [Methylophilus aquaticus]MDP8566428.1 hypothetical protein [Methylophilus aquaticus]